MAEKVYNVVDDGAPSANGTRFLQEVERIACINAECFGLESRVRSYRCEDEPFFVEFSVRQPKSRTVAEQKQIPRGFDPSLSI